MAAQKSAHAKLKGVHSLPCIHSSKQAVFPQKYPSAPQLMIHTEIPTIIRLNVFKLEDFSLQPAICEWESFPPYARKLLQDSVEKSSFLFGNYNRHYLANCFSGVYVGYYNSLPLFIVNTGKSYFTKKK